MRRWFRRPPREKTPPLPWPQYGEADVKALMGRIAKAGKPCLSIMPAPGCSPLYPAPPPHMSAPIPLQAPRPDIHGGGANF